MYVRTRTGYGELEGSERDGVVSFKGIPFAAPPTGPRRWRAPEPPDPWRGVRAARTFGYSAIQAPAGPLGEMIGIASSETDEDCLTLNVWTPGIDEGRRPVLVYVHGGGNTVGSSSQPRFDGQHLARAGNVVVVTLSYRLGALGFLHAPELGATGNEALLDQVAALRWVQQEIASFGGDPDDVLLFGQSAGGFDIAQLMGMRVADGTFAKVAPLSGSLRPPIPKEQARAVARRFAERLGGFEALRNVPAKELLAVQLELTGGQIPAAVRFGPVLDGEVIPVDPATHVGAGTYTRGKPLLIGHTRDEWRLWAGMSTRMQAMSRADLADQARRIFGSCTDDAIDVYTRALAGEGRRTEPVDLWVAMVTDEMFRMPAIRTAELHAQHTAAVHFYRFDYASPALGGKLGACHSLDLPFIWGTHSTENLPVFCGRGREVERLSALMMDVYLAFARTGDPRSAALPDWPVYEAKQRATMRLGLDVGLEEAPLDSVRAFWAELDEPGSQ